MKLWKNFLRGRVIKDKIVKASGYGGKVCYSVRKRIDKIECEDISLKSMRDVMRHYQRKKVNFMFGIKNNNQFKVNEIRTDFELKLLNKAKTMVPGLPPLPWSKRVYIRGAGIIAGGWDKDDNFFLISDYAYSINNPLNGEVSDVIYDYQIVSKNLSNDYLRFKKPSSNEVINIFGLNSGDGIHINNDGWNIEVIYPWWPRASVIINNVFENNASSREYLDKTYMIDIKELDGWIKCGFSNSGNKFAILGSGGAVIFSMT